MNDLSKIDLLNTNATNMVVGVLAEAISRSAYMNFPPELTGRTKNSIRYEGILFGNGATIHIDPQAYKIGEYLQNKRLVDVPGLGYAKKLNDEGSPWGNHIGFIDNAINIGINAFKQVIESTGEYEVIIG